MGDGEGFEAEKTTVSNTSKSERPEKIDEVIAALEAAPNAEEETEAYKHPNRRHIFFHGIAD